MTTLLEGLLRHNNDYGFDPHELGPVPSVLPDTSIVIPYFNDGPILRIVIHALRAGCDAVRQHFPSWQHEIIVIDDGSVSDPAASHLDRIPEITLVTLASNVGRARARQNGLAVARFEICLFMDSDIVVDHHLMLEMLSVVSRNSRRNERPCITVGLFETVDREALLKQPAESRREARINDFRVSCVYQTSWIGCEADKAFIGEDIHIIRDTNCFRQWPGKYKAWLLSNMVLGGFFATDRQAAQQVGGFDARFSEYGFTETSLPTKLIAGLDHYVIPIVTAGAIHADVSRSGPLREKKDELFRRAHFKYFQEYLKLDLSSVSCPANQD